MTVGEVLEAGPERAPGGRRWRWVAIAVVVVAGLAWGAGSVLDHRWRAEENDRLTACVRAADEATGAARNRVAGIAGFVQPGLRADTPDATVTSLYGLVARSADQAVADVEPVRGSCAGVAVRWWHRDQLAARTAALAYLDVVLEYFRATTADGRAYFEDDADLRRVRRAVTMALDQL